ncbi:hypothetical protein [Streptomyces sp. CBMA156]|uniref:hypothetical protein n=1 Tax=Streptomyces sp. CBMA156 TaxID=1930280 RepID=UPI001661E25D|nr:hypothetical protein [Streptomyces sp. CBMA156]
MERLTTARARVYAAVVLAVGDLERARESGERVREDDALAGDVWSAVRSCEEAYDDVHRAKPDAAHYEETAEVYRAAGALSDFVAECERMEDAAARAESAREETLNLYTCAFEDSATAVENRRRLQESTASDRPVLDEVIADLEPDDEVAVSNREVGGGDAAAAIEERGAMPHSVTEPHQPTRMFGYVATARGSADLQRAET